MIKRRKDAGFTLLELVIVLAIIGGIVAIAVPNLINAHQKSKARTAVMEMANLSKIMSDYVAEVGKWDLIVQAGPLVANSALIRELTKLSADVINVNDPWGNP